jgi:hypothetical protein
MLKMFCCLTFLLNQPSRDVHITTHNNVHITTHNNAHIATHNNAKQQNIFNIILVISTHGKLELENTNVNNTW